MKLIRESVLSERARMKLKGKVNSKMNLKRKAMTEKKKPFDLVVADDLERMGFVALPSRNYDAGYRVDVSSLKDVQKIKNYLDSKGIKYDEYKRFDNTTIDFDMSKYLSENCSKKHKSLKESDDIKVGDVPTHTYDGKLKEGDLYYTLIIFDKRDENGRGLLWKDPEDAFDIIYFNSIESAKKYADRNFLDAWSVVIRENDWNEGRKDAWSSGPVLIRQDGEWHKPNEIWGSLKEGKNLEYEDVSTFEKKMGEKDLWKKSSSKPGYEIYVIREQETDGYLEFDEQNGIIIATVTKYKPASNLDKTYGDMIDTEKTKEFTNTNSAIKWVENQLLESKMKRKLKETQDITDKIILKTSEDGFLTKKRELQNKGYKTIWAGDGQICMAKPQKLKEKYGTLKEGNQAVLDAYWDSDVDGSSEYIDLVIKFAEYSLDRLKEEESEDIYDEINHEIDDGLTYYSDLWTIIEENLTPQDLGDKYYEALDAFENDVYKVVETYRKNNKNINVEETCKKKHNKGINEMLVEMDEDDVLDLLMNRLGRWNDDNRPGDLAYDLYEQMYQNYLDSGAFEGSELDPMIIVDNDWVNYCDIVEPGDELYDKVLKAYNENGVGDISSESAGYSYIEAVEERNGKIYFLCRW